MKIPACRKLFIVGFVVSALSAGPAASAPLTAEQAVALALRNNVQVVQADAGVLDARGGLYSAYSGILPHLSASVSRNNSVTTGSRSPLFGSLILEQDAESHGTVPSVSGTWSVLDLSAITGFQSARNGLKAARSTRHATRNEVVLAVRQQFYSTVQTYHLARVAAGGLRVARDNQRRVRALFEVGSVSKSDLLQAQVRTAQAELDSLTANGNILDARIVLADQIGVGEGELGEVDTVLVAAVRDYDEAELQREAAANRPDLLAARAALSSAKSNRTSARLARIPSLEASSTVQFDTESRRTTTTKPPGVPGPPFNIDPGVEFTTSQTDRQWSGSLALFWNVFDGLATEGRSATSEARLRRARVDLDALERRLSGEVRQAVLNYQEAVERERVASRAYEAAVENLKLTQQKYNVGSSTILELVDAQEQATRVEADGVSARAAIRIAEAQIERVRGRGE